MTLELYTVCRYYEKELLPTSHSSCPASAELLFEAREHFQNGRAICDCGCGAVDPDCTVNGVTVDCENFANIDPLTLRYDPLAPEQAVPDTCLCVDENATASS